MAKMYEDLNLARVEDPTSDAAKAAKKLNLTYVGFGRYENPKTGQISHIVQNGKLVPFNRATKTNTFKQENSDDIGNYSAIMQPEMEELTKALATHYSADKYDNREIDAISHFANEGYDEINQRLASLPANVPANQLETLSDDDRMADVIASLDSAAKKSRAPGEFVVYAKLGEGQDMFEFAQGRNFSSKGFLVSSVSLQSVIRSIEPEKMAGSRTGRPVIALLQIRVKKNAKGIYMSNFSSTDEGEFMFPRGAKFTVMADPSKLVGSDAMTGNLSLEIQYIDCSYKS
jgi:ADP-ribosyltransferase exoenzyme